MAESGIVLPEPPPPRSTVVAIVAFLLNLLAVLALLFGSYALGTWLAVGALVFSGITVYLLLRPSGRGGTGTEVTTTGTTPSGPNPTGGNPTGTAAR